MSDYYNLNFKSTDHTKDVAILALIPSIIKNLRVSDFLTLEKSENFKNPIFSLKKVRKPFVL